MSTAKSNIVKLFKTEQGVIYLWECGGKIQNRISSTIVADSGQHRKKALYSSVSETRDGFRYAKIPIEIGDTIVKVFSDMDFNLSIGIYTVRSIDEEFNLDNLSSRPIAICNVIDYFSKGEWGNNEHEKYIKMVNAALLQATRFSRDALYVDYRQ